MSDGASVDLALATTDELIDELKSRHVASVILSSRPSKVASDGVEYFSLAYGGGLTACIGLCERAKARLLQLALAPNDDGDDD